MAGLEARPESLTPSGHLSETDTQTMETVQTDTSRRHDGEQMYPPGDACHRRFPDGHFGGLGALPNQRTDLKVLLLSANGDGAFDLRLGGSPEARRRSLREEDRHAGRPLHGRDVRRHGERRAAGEVRSRDRRYGGLSTRTTAPTRLRSAPRSGPRWPTSRSSTASARSRGSCTRRRSTA